MLTTDYDLMTSEVKNDDDEFTKNPGTNPGNPDPGKMKKSTWNRATICIPFFIITAVVVLFSSIYFRTNLNYLKNDYKSEDKEQIKSSINVIATTLSPIPTESVGESFIKNRNSLTLAEWRQFNVELRSIIAGSCLGDKYTPWPVGISDRIISRLAELLHIPIRKLDQSKYDKLNKLFKNLRNKSNHSHTVLVAVGGGLYRNQFMENLAKNGIQNMHSSIKNKYLESLSDYKFQISPEGNGIDCYRHYEALMFGQIPIINTRYKYGIIEKYGGVPILWTHDYSDINESYLLSKYNEMITKKYDYSRLFLNNYSKYEQYQIVAHGIMTILEHHIDIKWYDKVLNMTFRNDIVDIVDMDYKHKFDEMMKIKVKYPYVEDIQYVSQNEYIQILYDKFFYLHKSFFNPIRLKPYHLSFVNIDNKNIDNKYSINKAYNIIPATETMELIGAPMRSCGNMLSVYWGIRSLAYWSTYYFVIPKAYFNQWDQRLPSTDVFTFFLKRNITIRTKSNKDVFHKKLLKPNIVPNAWASNIHTTSLLFMYYNRFFQRIINYELLEALNNFYQANHRQSPNISNNNIVIHIRCGDVLNMLWKGSMMTNYGFLSMNFYKYVIKSVIVHEKEINANTMIYIISQMTNNSLRVGKERQTANACNYLINIMVNDPINGFKKIFSPATVNIVYDSDENDDYYQMINAQFLFCSPSTFCFNAAIANIKGIVIVPSHGPWLDLKILYDAKNERWPNYSGILYGNETDFIIKTELLPSNNVIIDTNASGWHCYRFDYKNESLLFYTKQLAQYLLTH